MTQPRTPLDDGALIKMALAGETECFAVLMDRHLGALKRCIGSMVRSGSEADDLLQDALIKVWCRLSTFRSEASFRTWMTRVAINEVLQSYRRDGRRPVCQILGDLDELPSSDESPQRHLIRIEATKAVRKAVEGLPERFREPLILRDLEQLSTEETAQSLQSTVPAVKSRLFRARLMLAAALQGSRVRGVPSGGRTDNPRTAACFHGMATCVWQTTITPAGQHRLADYRTSQR
jgi:RNA polymerase sigma-70 factor, ECF subfamily